MKKEKRKKKTTHSYSFKFNNQDLLFLSLYIQSLSSLAFPVFLRFLLASTTVGAATFFLYFFIHFLDLTLLLPNLYLLQLFFLLNEPVVSLHDFWSFSILNPSNVYNCINIFSFLLLLYWWYAHSYFILFFYFKQF